MSSAVLLLAVPSLLLSPATPLRAVSLTRTHEASMGLFDMFKETEAQKAAKEAEYQAQLEMINRRYTAHDRMDRAHMARPL